MKAGKLATEISGTLKHISSAVSAERSSFFLINSKNNTLDSYYAEGINNLIISLPLGKGIVGHVVKNGISAIENNAPQSAVFDNSIDSQLNFTTQNIVCVPVFNEHEAVIGAVECINSKKGKFNDSDLRILLAFSSTLSLIIKNATLYELACHVNNNYSTLLNAFGAVSAEFDLDKLIPLVMEKAAYITKSDRASLFFIDDETKELWSKYGTGLEAQTIRTKKGIVGLVARQKKSKIVNDPYNNKYFDSSVDAQTGYVTKSILTVPVFNASQQILGVLQVINKENGKFDYNDLAILEGFAGQIRIAIENAQLFKQVSGMKNYLDILVQNLDNGIVTVDMNGYIQATNGTFYKIFNIPESQAPVGKSIKRLNKKISHLLQYSEQIIKSGEKHYEYNVEFLTADKKKVITNLSVLPMHDTNNSIIGVINLFHDVTRENRIRSNLNRYIPQHLVKELIDRDDISLLQGHNQRCSILFSDIRNFTRLTEELGAGQIVSLLNKYFDAMVDSVNKHNGVLDKFIGDAIMAVFGVPYTNNSDAINAVSCAMEMFKLIDENNFLIKNNITIGVGISTGMVISGNIGSEKRYEYTVIGDSVNLAARLEDATKMYGVRLLICENTYKSVREVFNCREVDVVLLKGKHNPVKIYTVIGTSG